jgi:hypothetical protein
MISSQTLSIEIPWSPHMLSIEIPWSHILSRDTPRHSQWLSAIRSWVSSSPSASTVTLLDISFTSSVQSVCAHHL